MLCMYKEKERNVSTIKKYDARNITDKVILSNAIKMCD